MRKFATLDQPGTSEIEVGGEGEDLTVLVSAGEAKANAKPPRTHKEQFNNEPLRVVTRMALLRQRRLPPPQERANSNNSNLSM